MTTTTHRPTLLTLGADGVLSLVASLPPWQRGLDDDPVWLRTVAEIGLRLHESVPEHRNAAATTRFTDLTPEDVDLGRVTGANQPWVRLDALAFYLEHPDALFDRDGWFGNDWPVLAQIGSELVVMDGTSRVGAHRLRGDHTLRAHVVRL